MESRRRLLHRAAIRGACLDRGVARRPGLDAHRSDRGRGAGAPGARRVRLLADSLPAASTFLHSTAGSTACRNAVGRLQPVVAGAAWSNSTCARSSTCSANSASIRRSWRAPGLGLCCRLDAVDCLGGRCRCAAVSRASKPDRIGARLAARHAQAGSASRRARAAHEGPLDFAQRIAAARPDLAAQVTALAARYCAAALRPGAGRRRHRGRWNAKSGSWRCEPHAPQQHAADHEQQHQGHDGQRASLPVRPAMIAMSSGPSTVANLPIML